MNKINKKIVVGMSGGVDSSVSAYLLKQQGYEVIGLFMQNWQNEPGEKCTSEIDFNDASDVCDQLDIPLHKANFADDYWNRVFKEFLLSVSKFLHNSCKLSCELKETPIERIGAIGC